jgi:hypothetical protein
MRLLCAVTGTELGAGDPYDGLGLPRNEVKLAINVMLNAASWPSARGALIKKLRPVHGQSVGIRVNQLRDTIQERFPALDKFWNSDCGVTLQKRDADICTRLQQTLRQQGVPCLSVHDSFIVPQSAGALTEAAMNEEFDRTCQQLRAKR